MHNSAKLKARKISSIFKRCLLSSWHSLFYSWKRPGPLFSQPFSDNKSSQEGGGTDKVVHPAAICDYLIDKLSNLWSPTSISIRCCPNITTYASLDQQLWHISCTSPDCPFLDRCQIWLEVLFFFRWDSHGMLWKKMEDKLQLIPSSTP